VPSLLAVLHQQLQSSVKASHFDNVSKAWAIRKDSVYNCL